MTERGIRLSVLCSTSSKLAGIGALHFGNRRKKLFELDSTTVGNRCLSITTCKKSPEGVSHYFNNSYE